MMQWIKRLFSVDDPDVQHQKMIKSLAAAPDNVLDYMRETRSKIVFIEASLVRLVTENAFEISELKQRLNNLEKKEHASER